MVRRPLKYENGPQSGPDLWDLTNYFSFSKGTVKSHLKPLAQEKSEKRTPSVRKMNKNAPSKGHVRLHFPWTDLAHHDLDYDVMRKHRIFMGKRDHKAHRDVDMLRT